MRSAQLLFVFLAVAEFHFVWFVVQKTLPRQQDAIGTKHG